MYGDLTSERERGTTRRDCQRFPRLVGVTYEVINAAVSCEPVEDGGSSSLRVLLDVSKILASLEGRLYGPRVPCPLLS